MMMTMVSQADGLVGHVDVLRLLLRHLLDIHGKKRTESHWMRHSSKRLSAVS